MRRYPPKIEWKAGLWARVEALETKLADREKRLRALRDVALQRGAEERSFALEALTLMSAVLRHTDLRKPLLKGGGR